ncbi:MAG TPA: transporter substrate-binding domain-containing protein [Chitinophagaceae bacterium]|jgi:polar amino acid transport system substrate-binding protein|nr:transporter substrate-binding domain-containing protein [Chitinophagaceae bacterium]
MRNRIYDRAFLSKKWIILLCLAFTLSPQALYAGYSAREDTLGGLMVGIAGTPPFVVDTANDDGISIEIFQAMALQLGWKYKIKYFDDVPQALQALESGKIDVVAGPVSITSERAQKVSFTQPYYQSSLSILSRTDAPSLWQRISPFFSTHFFIAVGIFILILGGVGTVLWLTEREDNSEQFPAEPAKGIANGMWCAIVTMSTTGYGDKAPVTFWGRLVAASWMVVSIIFATTMVAGIASTLTLTGLNTTVISTANALAGKKVAVVAGSPAEDFIRHYRGGEVEIKSLQEGYDKLKAKQVDAVVYDRPQLLYFLQQHQDDGVAVSIAEYSPQGYGFALPLHSRLLHRVNIELLTMEESGRVDRIVSDWLGNKR